MLNTIAFIQKYDTGSQSGDPSHRLLIERFDITTEQILLNHPFGISDQADEIS